MQLLYTLVETLRKLCIPSDKLICLECHSVVPLTNSQQRIQVPFFWVAFLNIYEGWFDMIKQMKFAQLHLERSNYELSHLLYVGSVPLSCK